MNRSLPLTVAVLGAAAATGAVPATAAAATKTTKYTGATETYRYGTLRVTISVAKKKMTAISVSYAPDSPRSSQLDSVAFPALWKEALKAQAWNVHSISGVSFSSQAFNQSLYSAMKHADLLKK
jgi:uncharacterized protein with FMN-binding domain